MILMLYFVVRKVRRGFMDSFFLLDLKTGFLGELICKLENLCLLLQYRYQLDLLDPVGCSSPSM